jgi:predicted negative regulator of RcsB-dependent stress response
MQLVIIGVLIVLGMAGAGSAYQAGVTNGSNGERLKWQSALNDANAKAEKAIAATAEIVADRDKQIAAVLASKKADQDAADAQLETLRTQIPLSGDCSKCFVDVRRLRQGTGSAASDHQTRVPASSSK